MDYRVSKVLNNNTVISRDEDGNEIIVTGNGIGYGKHPGMMIDGSQIRNVYEPRSKAFLKRFEKMISEIPEVCFLEAEKIRDMAESDLKKRLNDNIILALADHIHFVITQYLNDETRAVLMNTEFQKIYAEEYEVAKKAVKMIEKDLDVKLTEGEVSAITFHLVNSEIGSSSNDAVKIAASVKDLLKIIRESFDLDEDDERIDYSRLIIHLKFFLKRVLSDQTEENNDFGTLILNPNEGSFAGISDCLNRITAYMAETYSYQISEAERFYLLIHIARLLQKR